MGSFFGAVGFDFGFSCGSVGEGMIVVVVVEGRGHRLLLGLRAGSERDMVGGL